MANRLQDKVAIVTGAGSIGEGIGNGKATAIVFAREGAKVMLVDLNLEAAEETSTVIESEGGECIVFQADVSSSKGCTAIVDQCLRSFGRADILHNNVGIEEAGGLEDTSETSWGQKL